MDIKSIGKIISETPDFEVDKTTKQPASASGLSEIADGIEIAANPQQQNLFSADLDLKTFDPRERYTGVLMQQGRVQTDTDFNEQDSMNVLEDGVVVEFQSGDMRDSYVTGDLWNFADRPPEESTATNDSDSSTTSSDPDKP